MRCRASSRDFAPRATSSSAWTSCYRSAPISIPAPAWRRMLMAAPDRPAQRRALVTGGAGFIGSHTVAALLAAGWRVDVLDNLSSGDPANLPPEACLQLGDIRSDSDVDAAFRGGPYDAVVHCAAQTNVGHSMTDPGLDWEINARGTLRLLEASERQGSGRFVFISSGGAIYGNTAYPVTEDTLPAPASYYGLHKYAAEQLLRAKSPSHAILRPSNVYGPRQRSDIEGGVVAIFAQQLREGRSVRINGDGLQSRDFVHVRDLAAAVLLAIDWPGNLMWNVSTGRGTTIIQLARLMSEIGNRELSLTYGPTRA